MNRILTFLLLALLTYTWDDLPVGSELKVSLKGNQPHTFTLVTNQTSTANTDLLVIADPLL